MAAVRQGFWFAGLGAFGGVDADQVMELVPVPPGFLKQVPAGQGSEQLPCSGIGASMQGRSRGRADILARMQAQEPEGPGWRWRKRPVGPGEDGADLCGLLIGGQGVQAIVLKGQFIDQVGHAEMADELRHGPR